MMDKIRIPTIIGLFLLITSLPIAVILVKQRQIFRLGAEGNYPPQDVKITNITSSSFSVIWTTSQRTTGFVIWGESENNLNQTALDEIEGKSFVHSSTISGLSPNKNYFFKIISDDKTYDNNQKAWEVKTAPPLNNASSDNIRIGGKVITASGTEATNILVILNIEGAQVLSTTTSGNGNWIININSLLDSNLSNYLQSVSNLKVSIIAQAGPQGISTAEAYLATGLTLPPMILGENHDFTNITSTTTNQEASLPSSEIETPEEKTKKPRFDIEENEKNTTTNKTVSLESIEDGETIYTTKPEFFGKAPPQEQITIKVESESPISDTIRASSDGTWRWSPPKNLSPGEHKITITYRDENGILRNIVRNFTIKAAETDEPAFESTPSASLTPTPLAFTPTPKIASPSATPAQPESGVKTPTLILLFAGLLLFTASGVLLFTN